MTKALPILALAAVAACTAPEVRLATPQIDSEVAAGDPVAVVESVKAASDIYAPLTGEVLEVNEELEDSPELVNSDAYGDGWMFKLRASDESELDNLLSAEDYAASIEDED